METHLPTPIISARVELLIYWRVYIYIYTSYISHVVPIYFPWLFPFENGSQQDRFRPYYVPGLVGLMSLGVPNVVAAYGPGFFAPFLGDLTDQKLGFHGFFDVF